MTDIVRIFKCVSEKYIKLFEYMLIDKKIVLLETVITTIN